MTIPSNEPPIPTTKEMLITVILRFAETMEKVKRLRRALYGKDVTPEKKP